MSTGAKLRLYSKVAYDWRWFLVRTAGYSTVSVSLRPLFGEKVPHWLMGKYLVGALRQLGIMLAAEGTDKLANVPPCIIAVNHNSLLDIPCVGALLDFRYKWVAKKEIFRIPFVGWHLRACGHIHVDRERRDNLMRLQNEFKRVLAEGTSILLFPEGTRSVNGAMKPFRTGAFVTAVSENVPVLPIVLNGTDKLMLKGSLEFPGATRKIVQVKVMDLVMPPDADAGSFDERVADMRDRTRALMVRGLDALRGEQGAAERPTQPG